MSSLEDMIKQDAERVMAATDTLCRLHSKRAAGVPGSVPNDDLKRARDELTEAFAAALSRAHPGLTVRNFK